MLFSILIIVTIAAIGKLFQGIDSMHGPHQIAQLLMEYFKGLQQVFCLFPEKCVLQGIS